MVGTYNTHGKMNKSDNYRYFTHLKMGERGIFSEEGQGAAL